MAELKVGQILIYVRSDTRNKTHSEAEIASIGRKWVNFKGYYTRADKDTLIADGGQYSSPGRYYLSEKDWEDERELHAEWNKLRNNFGGYQPPENLTLEKIRQITEIMDDAS